MLNKPELSEAKRELLERYLRGEVSRATRLMKVADRNEESASGASGASAAPEQPTRSALVTIQQSGFKPPLFYCHVHVEGGAFYCFTLSHYLGADQPFYVLDPYKFDGLKIAPTLEEMAADYIQNIRTIQPEGPYYLTGFCGGGLIAFEIAQQLRAQGQEVELLLLVDPTAGPIDAIRTVVRLIRRVGKLIGIRPEKQLDCFIRFRQIYRVLRHAEDEYSQRFPLLTATKALRQDWMGIFCWVVAGYMPHEYSGKVTYFWARDESGRRTRWWRKEDEVGGMENYKIPGTHTTCRTEHIQAYARQLSVCLNKTQEDRL